MENTQAIKDAQQQSKSDKLLGPGHFVYIPKTTVSIQGYREAEVFSLEQLFEYIDKLKVKFDNKIPELAIQKKFDGVSVEIHRTSSKITIFTGHGNIITKRMPSLVKKILNELPKEDYIAIAEVEMWVKDSHSGRSIVSGYLNAETSPDDSNLVINFFDLIWFDKKDIHNSDYKDRYTQLKKFNFSQSLITKPKPGFNLAPTFIAHQITSIQQAVKSVSKPKESEGAILKFWYGFKFRLNKFTNEMIKYKKFAEGHFTVLDKRIISGTKKTFQYEFGVILSVSEKKTVDESKIIRYNKQDYLICGKTYNTNINALIGDILTIRFNNLNVYHNKKDELYVGVYGPTVYENRTIGQEDEDPDTLTTLLAIGEESGLLVEKGIGIYISKAKDIFMQYPKEGSNLRYVMQEHFRGQSVSDRTPIIVRRNNIISVIPIEELWPTSLKGEGTLPLINIDVWTKDNWTPAKYIFRHSQGDPLLRVNTPSGLIEVTPEHSLFKENSSIKTCDLKVGDNIDHCSCFPQIGGSEYVDLEYAFLIGLFLAEGSVHPKGTLQICNTDLDLLGRVQKFCIAYGWKTNIYINSKGLNKPVFVLNISGLRIFDFITSPKSMRKRECKSYLKKIPDYVFNWHDDCLNSLIEGFLLGDGVKGKKAYGLSSQALVQGLLLIMNHLLIDLTFTVKSWADLIYVSFVSLTHNRFDQQRHEIKRILPSLRAPSLRGESNSNFKDGIHVADDNRVFKSEEWVYARNRYVYDIETENHDFMAGVGCIRAHNSAHIDFRVEMKSDGNLIGYTIMNQVEGAIDKPVVTLSQAEKYLKDDKNWKYNPLTGNFQQRETEQGKRKASIQTALKEGIIPNLWLNVSGVTPKGSVGATKNYPGVFAIAAQGKVEFGFREPYFHEYYVHNKDWPNGGTRLVFRMLASETLGDKFIDVEKMLYTYRLDGSEAAYNPSNAIAYYDRMVSGELGGHPKAPAFYLRNEFKGPYFMWDLGYFDIPFEFTVTRGGYLCKLLPPGEEPERETPFIWLTIEPNTLEPYILSLRAEEKKKFPPIGISALPKNIKDQIPKEFKYWDCSSSKEMQIRLSSLRVALKSKEVVLNCDERIFEKKVKFVKSDAKTDGFEKTTYILKKRSWRGPIVIRLGVSVIFYDLYIRQSEDKWHHFVLMKNPVLIDSLAGFKEHDADDHDASFEGDLPPEHELNPNKELDVQVQILTKGQLFLKEVNESENENTWHLEFESGDLKKRSFKAIKNADIWKFEINND